MGYLKIDIEDKFTSALGAKLKGARINVEHAVAADILRRTEPFVPARTKSLANRAQSPLTSLSGRTEVKGNAVIYPGPYARFLYYGKLMIDPETGSAWARPKATKIVTGKDLDIKTSVHAQAQSHWFEASKAQNLDEWVEVAERAVEREISKR